MRHLVYFFIAMGLLLNTACFKDQCTEVFPVNYDIPVYKLKSDIILNTRITGVQQVEAPGSIYLYQDYLYVNEFQKGIHVVQNSDPANPVNEKFIEIEGNQSVATYGKYMYADQYTDLVVVDLSTPSSPLILNRISNVINESLVIGDSILTGYEHYEGFYEVPCDQEIFFFEDFQGGGGPFILNTTAGGDGISGDIRNSGVLTGIAGSLAKFIVSRGHLYTLENHILNAFSLADPENPFKVFTTHVAGVETIFPMGKYLFLGTRFGMEIYDIENPSLPVRVSTYNHWKSCDPVFVYGDLVFVTLSSGNLCQNGVNELQVLDISNLFEPRLLYTFPMDNPKGLSVFNDKLWLCESEYGLKVFSISQLDKIDENLLDHEEDYHSIDIITLNDDHSILMTAEGIYQLKWNGDEFQGNVVELSKL